jgi:ABC-type antimicrobial peptide transport system permease subunit
MTVYWPQGQSPEGARTIELRTTVPPDTLMPAVRRTMNDIDPVIPLIGLSTQASALEDQWARERTIAMASTTLGALALAVSMIGLFGLASYAVTRRSKEIAIRMAVGAEARTVLRATMRESLVLVAAGVVIGLAISLSTTRFLRALLFGLAPNDPTVITAAVLTLVAVSIVAGYLPARRAARIDPMSTLRNE